MLLRSKVKEKWLEMSVMNLVWGLVLEVTGSEES